MEHAALLLPIVEVVKEGGLRMLESHGTTGPFGTLAVLHRGASHLGIMQYYPPLRNYDCCEQCCAEK